jgi:predicted XRE-type DNA-binding protein
MADTAQTQDPVSEALTNLSEVAASSAKDLTALDEGLVDMKRRRARGTSWREIISSAGSPNPLAAMASIATNLGRATGALRRALAGALRNEGMQVTEIAKLFDVSRQRVSALLRTRRINGTHGTDDPAGPEEHSTT